MKVKDLKTGKVFDGVHDAVNFFCDNRDGACNECPLTWERFDRTGHVAGCSITAIKRSPINIAHLMGYEVVEDDMTQKTNADHIRSMTDEELAKFLDDSNSQGCVCPTKDCEATCTQCIANWLKQPYKEN